MLLARNSRFKKISLNDRSTRLVARQMLTIHMSCSKSLLCNSLKYRQHCHSVSLSLILATTVDESHFHACTVSN